MLLEFVAEAIEWRGPAPYVFVPVPPELAEGIKAIARQASYGWGCIPARAQIGETAYGTSLFPKDGGYLVPLKVAVQRTENVGVGSVVALRLEIAVP